MAIAVEIANGTIRGRKPAVVLPNGNCARIVMLPKIKKNEKKRNAMRKMRARHPLCNLPS